MEFEKNGLKQIKKSTTRALLSFFKRHLSYSVKNKLKYLRQRIFNTFSTVVIETMTTCNRRCSFCPNGIFERGLASNEKIMETNLFHKIVNELAGLRWTGGIILNFFNEPLMDKRLPELIAYVRDRLPSCPVNIFTNGDFLNVELYKMLVKSGMNTLFITQYQKGEMTNLVAIKKYRETHGSGNVELIHEQKLLISNRGGLMNLPDNVATFKRCYVKFGRVMINHCGEIILCCQDYFSSVKLGDLNKERLMDVWNKPYYRKLRKEITKGIYTLELCRKCQTCRSPIDISTYDSFMCASAIK